jgi:hypothetical protein
VGVEADASTSDDGQDGVEDAGDVAWRRRPDRVPEADVVAAEVDEADRDGGGGGRRPPFVRAAEGDRHVAAASTGPSRRR